MHAGQSRGDGRGVARPIEQHVVAMGPRCIQKLKPPDQEAFERADRWLAPNQPHRLDTAVIHAAPSRLADAARVLAHGCAEHTDRDGPPALELGDDALHIATIGRDAALAKVLREQEAVRGERILRR